MHRFGANSRAGRFGTRHAAQAAPNLRIQGRGKLSRDQRPQSHMFGFLPNPNNRFGLWIVRKDRGQSLTRKRVELLDADDCSVPCWMISPHLSRHNSSARIIGLMPLSLHHLSSSPTVWRARWWVAQSGTTHVSLMPALDVGERPTVQLPGPDVLGVHFTGDPLPGRRSKLRCRKFFPTGFVS